ncbi:amidohydrolase family protein [Solimonas marina]|uniref:Amidohydrolase family protein n=1 Tax=Solimonas marina TaxID=2714601 RepID=A0A970B6W3_9GAMM|nr:amidohydrolase family protein [Solimonas marina]NKF23243.1 amidohydrolase family protein [Solimonas marina]
MKLHPLHPALPIAALALFAAMVAVPSRAATDDTTAIVHAQIFDAAGTAPYRGTLLIRDGRIAALGPDVKVPLHATVIDAKGETLMPGIFDLHTHWTPSSTPAYTPQIALAYLATGVTTVDDFNAAPESYAPRRQWLSTLYAPHVNFAARISTPLGHGADWADQNTTRWVNTPASARRAVDAVAAYHPDLIKAFTDGWRYGAAPDNTSMDEETLAALVDEAHKFGLKVATHTVTIDRGRIAAEAGVDIIAHSLQDRPIDAETLALIKKAGTYYIPTLAVYEPIKPDRPLPYPIDDPRMQARLHRFDDALHNLKAVYDAGIPVAVGTDAGMFAHRGATEHELELMVRAGLTPEQALIAATRTSASALKLQDDRGTLEVGKRADLILVDGTPWTDITAMRKVQRTFVDGVLVYGPGAKIPPTNRIDHMPAIKVPALVDDFERDDGRTALDTLRVDEADGGQDRTIQTTTTITHGDGKALLVAAQLSSEPDAFASAILPLSRGQIAPADLRQYHGVRLQIRGEVGRGAVALRTAGSLRWQHDISVGAHWASVDVPFNELAALKPAHVGLAAADTSWAGDDLTGIAVVGYGAPGQKIWLEIDDVRFY